MLNDAIDKCSCEDVCGKYENYGNNGNPKYDYIGQSFDYTGWPEGADISKWCETDDKNNKPSDQITSENENVNNDHDKVFVQVISKNENVNNNDTKINLKKSYKFDMIFNLYGNGCTKSKLWRNKFECDKSAMLRGHVVNYFEDFLAKDSDLNDYELIIKLSGKLIKKNSK